MTLALGTCRKVEHLSRGSQCSTTAAVLVHRYSNEGSRTMVRRVILGVVVAASTCAAFVPAASASPIGLYMSQGAAFSILGRSCGGIQEKVYATGFGSDGYPTGDVYLSDAMRRQRQGRRLQNHHLHRAGSVVWTWFGETRSDGADLRRRRNTSSRPTDSHGDRLYNVGIVRISRNRRTAAPSSWPRRRPSTSSSASPNRAKRNSCG